MALTVGIDLGTTHTVLAWADAHGRARVFEIPQLVSAAELEALPLLASCLYAPAAGERLVDHWNDAPWTIGAFARRRGQEVPGRFVASAKSWLSYAAVDRRAPILPWGVEGAEVQSLSPVEASQRILEHVRRAWDQQFPEQPLSQQSLVLTVPASFDEAARELTVEAAHRAGLQVRLLEEPQAAVYDFMAQAGSAGLERLLTEARERALILVCDVGGGTTDLTLIDVSRGPDSELLLERVAVGRHLLLGGDNIDLALAQRCEAELVPPPARLDLPRFTQLVLACRSAKERLLSADPPDSVPISLAGSGAALVGSTLTVRLARVDVESLVFEGFLPQVERDARAPRPRSGLVAFGLPYEQDPAITRHVTSFLSRHAPERTPDALLLNGGLFRAERAAERLRRVLARWGGRDVELLPHPDPDLAVARGAVAYGLSLGGQGQRITGGTAHGYYVAVETAEGRRALCVVPRGAREGERHVASSRRLSLRLGQPVRFELFTLDTPEVHAAGAVVALDEEQFQRLPPISTSFEGSDATAQGEVSVALEGELSAIGTVELHCVELQPPDGRAPRRFRLAFELRAAQASTGARSSTDLPRPRAAAAGKRLSEAHEALSRVFGKSRSDVKPRESKDLVRELERVLGERRSWSLETTRSLFDELVAGEANRRRSEDHERVFWMLAGYCLRPGFGHPADPDRVAKLAALFQRGLSFGQAARVWQQYWIAWRRVAAGLDQQRQVGMRDSLDPFLAPAELKLKKPKQKPQAQEEMLELAAFLERVPAARRSELGERLLQRRWTSRDPRLWAALGYVGARVPVYASVHHVVPAHVAEHWLDHLLRERWGEVPTAARAAFQLARVTDDRARDVGKTLREQVRRRLESEGAPAEWLRAVNEYVAVGEAERAASFSEDLPVGLRLLEGA